MLLKQLQYLNDYYIVLHDYYIVTKTKAGWIGVLDDVIVAFRWPNLATLESGHSAENLLLSGKMASNVEAPERWYLALLGFAEHFRTSSPPKIRLCVHCLQAVFQFKPPQRIEARTHLQLGSVLYHHTKNSELARSHLEKAVRDVWSGKERGCGRGAGYSRPQAGKVANDDRLWIAAALLLSNIRTWPRLNASLVSFYESFDEIPTRSLVLSRFDRTSGWRLPNHSKHWQGAQRPS